MTALAALGDAVANESQLSPAVERDTLVQIPQNAHHERQALLQRFIAKDWKALDRRLREVQRLHRDGTVDGEFFVDVLGVFRRDAPGVAKKMEHWIGAMPNAWTAELAAGVYYHHLGWRSRGSRVIDRTVPEQISVMRELFKRAVGHFDRTLELNDKLAPAYANLMDIAKTGIKITKKRQSAREDLLQVYERGTDALPDFPLLYKAYIHCLLPQWGGTEAEQVSVIKELMTRFGKHPRFRWLHDYADSIEAGKLFGRGDLEGAVSLYDKIIQRTNDVAAHMLRASVLTQLNRHDDAIHALQAAAVARPHNPKPHYHMWMLLNRQGQRLKAFEHLDRALELDPLNANYLLPRAHYNIKRGALDEAEADLRNALFFGAFDERVHNAWASLHKKRSDTEKAIQAFRRAISIAPDHPYFWSELGDLMASSDECGAKRAYQRLLQLCGGGKKCPADRLVVVRKRIEELVCLSDQHQMENEREDRRRREIGEGAL